MKIHFEAEILDFYAPHAACPSLAKVWSMALRMSSVTFATSCCESTCGKAVDVSEGIGSPQAARGTHLDDAILLPVVVDDGHARLHKRAWQGSG